MVLKEVGEVEKFAKPGDRRIEWLYVGDQMLYGTQEGRPSGRSVEYPWLNASLKSQNSKLGDLFGIFDKRASLLHLPKLRLGCRWLRMVFPGGRLFQAPIWCPFGRCGGTREQGALSRRAW